MITYNEVLVSSKGGQQMSVSSKQQSCMRQPGSSLLVLFMSAASCLVLPSCQKHVAYEILWVWRNKLRVHLQPLTAVWQWMFGKRGKLWSISSFKSKFETTKWTSCCLSWFELVHTLVYVKKIVFMKDFSTVELFMARSYWELFVKLSLSHTLKGFLSHSCVSLWLTVSQPDSWHGTYLS